MKKQRKSVLIIALLLVLSMALTACGGTATTAAPATTTAAGTEATTAAPAADKVIFSNGGPEEFFETPWLNPGSFFYNKAIYAHLIVADENLSPLASSADALASSYEYSADGKTLTFTLRDDAYWHDGEKITPEDVKWSIEYSTKTAVLNAVFKSTFLAIAGSDEGKADTFSGIAIDGNKIVITFENVAPDALLTFTQFAPLPKKYFDGIDPLKLQQAPFFQKPVGSGPFYVDDVQLKNYTTLKAFDKYYNGVADFSIQLLPSAGDSDPNFVTRVKSGQMDFGYTKNVADVQSLGDATGITLTPVNVRYTRMFYLNKFAKADGSASPLADVRVRQAINYAIDMKAITDGLFMGTALPADVLIPGASDKASGLNAYDYNPEMAKQLLAEAKWNPDTVLTVVHYYKDQTTVDLMTAIQAYLKDVGIKMDFKLVEGDLATILWAAPQDQVKGPSVVEWDMCYGAVAALSLHEYYNRFRTGSATNSHTPEDAKLNELIDATNASANVADQMTAFKALSQYENETLPAIALYYQPIFLVTSDRIGDILKGNPQFCYNWDIQNWDVK